MHGNADGAGAGAAFAYINTHVALRGREARDAASAARAQARAQRRGLDALAGSQLWDSHQLANAGASDTAAGISATQAAQSRLVTWACRARRPMCSVQRQ